MKKYLVIQTGYSEIELALFEDSNKLAQKMLNNKLSSGILIPEINNILNLMNSSLSDIDFFVLNLGPAPFTTIRVVISTINGIAFALKKPIIGLNGLLLLLEQYSSKDFEQNAAILNAYSNDVYFALQQKNKEPILGATSIDTLLSDLANFNLNTNIFGPATTMFRQKIESLSNLHIGTAQGLSLDFLAQKGLDDYLKGINLTYQALPIYLKNHYAK